MTHPEEFSCWTSSATTSRGCSSRFDEFYYDSDSPRAASRDESRLEPSTSTGETHMSRISLDSRISCTGSGIHANKVRRLSSPWCDDAYKLDRCNIVEPIREETNCTPSRRSGRSFMTYTPELISEKHRPSIDDTIRRLRRIRREMEEGIEEMHCQMYQIQFCNSALKQGRQEKQMESKTLMNRHSPASGLSLGTPDSRKSPSERIPSSRDMFYESSRSGMDHSPDYCAASQKAYSPDRERYSVSPIRTPLLMETSDTTIVRTQMMAPSDFSHDNNRCEISGLPIPEVSAFQIEPSDSFTSEGSGQGEFSAGGHGHRFGTDREPYPTRVHAYASRGLKTDVVLNLNSSPHFSKPLKPMDSMQQPSPKTSALDKFIGLFCKKKSKKSERTRSRRQSLCQRTKTFGKWSHRSPKLTPSHKQAASCGCKFTDKYPINCDPTSENQRLQTFCPKLKGESVELISDSTACSVAGTGRRYVFSADSVANGIACFDVTCERLSGWCYVGIVGKNTEMDSQESVSECETSHGWSNEGECFRNGIPHSLSADEPFRTGTNIQVRSHKASASIFSNECS